MNLAVFLGKELSETPQGSSALQFIWEAEKLACFSSPVSNPNSCAQQASLLHEVNVLSESRRVDEEASHQVSLSTSAAGALSVVIVTLAHKPIPTSCTSCRIYATSSDFVFYSAQS